MTKRIYPNLALATAGATLLSFAAFLAKPAQASSLVGESFQNFYSSQSLGRVPGVPYPYGGLTFLPDDPNTIYITGNADYPDAKIYSIGVTRDSNNRITGYSGEASFVSEAVGLGTGDFPGADGGLVFGPDNVLFFTTFDNTLGQILPGSTTPDKLVSLTELGVEPTTGALNFVPEGFPGEGALKIGSYSASTLYTTTISPDGTGTFDIAPTTGSIHLGGAEEAFVGPEAFVYVNENNSGFEVPSLVISQWNGEGAVAYEVDENGDPILETGRQFLNYTKKNGGPEGLVIDPLTGDFLVSNYVENELGSQLLLVPSEPSEPTTPDNDPFDSATPIDLSAGSGSASGAVSTGNEIYSFAAEAGDLLSLDVDVTESLPGVGYADDDSVLYLYNSSGQILAVGEDKIDSYSSRILNFLVPADDTYYAAITTFGNEPIVELGDVNTLLGFEETGLSNIVYDFGISSQMLPETARLFNIALAADPTNPVGNVLIDGNSVLSIDLNGTRNTDLTGPLTISVNPDDNTLTFDNFEFILEFAEPFASTDIDEILDSLETSTITAVIPPDEFVQDILFSEGTVPGKSIPEPASILGLLGVGLWGASSQLQRKSRS